MIHLDTHVVAWLYAGDVGRFPASVLDRLESEDLAISPMVILELQYLFEIGRTSSPGDLVFEDLERRIGLRLCESPLPEVVTAALKRTWTRDPFDRMIASQAEVAGAALLTKDRALLDHEGHTGWS